MKRILSFVLSIMLLLMLLPYAAAAEEPASEGTVSAQEPGAARESSSAEKRVILTIGDKTSRSGNRYNKNLGLWQYLADLVGVEIRYVYLSQEDYDAGLASGDLPDIVATDKNLSRILENGVALDADPVLSVQCD